MREATEIDPTTNVPTDEEVRGARNGIDGPQQLRTD